MMLEYEVPKKDEVLSELAKKQRKKRKASAVKKLSKWKKTSKKSKRTSKHAVFFPGKRSFQIVCISVHF